MPKVKIPAAMNRIYERVWICMRCNSHIRADAEAVGEKRVKCRRCGYKGLRLKSKERKV